MQAQCSPPPPKAQLKEHPKHPQQGLAAAPHLYRNRLPLKNKLLLDTVRTWLDFSSLQGTESRVSAPLLGTRAEPEPCLALLLHLHPELGTDSSTGLGSTEGHPWVPSDRSPWPHHRQDARISPTWAGWRLWGLHSARSPRMLPPQPSAPTPGQPLPRPQARAERHRHQPLVHSAGRGILPSCAASINHKKICKAILQFHSVLI